MKLRLVISTLCVASLGMTGCASKVTQPDEYSGFLSDYSHLKEAKSPSGAEVMRWVDPKLDLSRYTAVYVEPTPAQLRPSLSFHEHLLRSGSSLLVPRCLGTRLNDAAELHLAHACLL